MVLQWPADGGRRSDQFGKALVVDFTARHHFPRFPRDRAGAGTLTLVPAVQHGPAREHDSRQIDGRRRHDLRRRGLVATGGQYDTVDGIAVKHLDQSKIGEIAIERRGRALAGFLDRVEWKLETHPPCLANAFANALGQENVMAITGRQIRAALGNPDNRLAGLQLFQRQAVVHGALEINRRHVGVGRIVEPGLGAKIGALFRGWIVTHASVPLIGNMIVLIRAGQPDRVGTRMLPTQCMSPRAARLPQLLVL